MSRKTAMVKFLKGNNACREGFKWAVDSCNSMTDVWVTAKPEWLVWVATRPGVLDDITLRRFACFSVRQIWHLLTDERSKRAVEVTELFCDGKATLAELNDAAAAAARAARAAAAAAAAAARAAARAAWAAAAWAEAAEAAAWAAAEAAAEAAAYEKQAEWLRANTVPTFEGGMI